MAYRIPDDELLTDAIVNVLLKNKTVTSQREISELVAAELNRNSEGCEYRVSGSRVRKLSIERKLVTLDIEYRDTAGEMPEKCPVCGRGLDSISNSTLEGGTAVILRKCRSCGYSASARSSIPSKYTFNMKAKRVSEIQSLKVERMNRAKEHIEIACSILDSLIDGHVLAHDAKETVAKLREICSGTDSPGTIANMIRALEVDEGDPVWTRPLASVKYCDRKDI